jgi:ribonuclease HI
MGRVRNDRLPGEIAGKSPCIERLLSGDGDVKRVPVIDCDPEEARERLEAGGVTVETGNTDHERWRASRGDATAVAYDEKVVVQGGRPEDLMALLEEGSGRVHAYFDGASRGNPGPAAVGWVLVSGEGIVAEGGERIGRATNNQAEYAALQRVLEAARDRGFDAVELRGDSELIVKQVRGAWNTNDPELRERRVRVRELLDGFEEWSLTHVPRDVNERADGLANEALEDG